MDVLQDAASSSDQLWNNLADSKMVDWLFGELSTRLGLGGKASLLYQVFKANPKLLLDPEVRDLAKRLLLTAGQHRVSELLGQDPLEVIDVLKVATSI